MGDDSEYALVLQHALRDLSFIQGPPGFVTQQTVANAVGSKPPGMRNVPNYLLSRPELFEESPTAPGSFRPNPSAPDPPPLPPQHQAQDASNNIIDEYIQAVVRAIKTKSGLDGQKYVEVGVIGSIAGRRPPSFATMYGSLAAYLNSQPDMFERSPKKATHFRLVRQQPAQPPSERAKSKTTAAKKKQSLADKLDDFLREGNVADAAAADPAGSGKNLLDLLNQRSTGPLEPTREGSSPPASHNPERLRQYMWQDDRSAQTSGRTSKNILFPERYCSHFHEYGALGRLQPESGGDVVYLNTSEPFCLVSCGIQGAGKSHTMSVVLENCMIPCPPITSLEKPLATLVLHYDPSESNFSGFTSVTQRALELPREIYVPVVPKIIVLLSPSYYKQRCRFYKGLPNVETRPLLFQWSALSASQIKALMRIDTDERAPLYMNVILELLRRFQREGRIPVFSEFLETLRNPNSDIFSSMQRGPLEQRLELLESFVADSGRNQNLPSFPFGDLVASGTVVLADLTDPLISPAEANGVFQVLVHTFKSASADCGRLLCLDEAHKYLGKESGDLGSTIVDIVRQMRHFGIRVAISTQSPLVLPQELLELVSVAILHQFQSREWLHFLASKLPFDPADFEEILSLAAGQALVFTARGTVLPAESQPPPTSRDVKEDDGGWPTSDNDGANDALPNSTFSYEHQDIHSDDEMQQTASQAGNGAEGDQRGVALETNGTVASPSEADSANGQSLQNGIADPGDGGTMNHSSRTDQASEMTSAHKVSFNTASLTPGARVVDEQPDVSGAGRVTEVLPVAPQVLRLKIRKRLTRDSGSSMVNSA